MLVKSLHLFSQTFFECYPFPSFPRSWLTRSRFLFPDLMPPIMAGILVIYGRVISVLISASLAEKSALHTNVM